MMGTPPNNRQRQQYNATSGNDDVGNLDQYLKKDDYEETQREIIERLTTLEGRVKDKSAVVTTLKEVFEGDRNIDEPLTTLINQHIDLSPAIEKGADKVNRVWIVAKLKSIWGFILAVLLLAIGAAIDHLFSHFIH